jgi:hypothetical protein
MNINIPTIQTLYTFSECNPATSYHKREQFMGAFFEDDDEYHTIEHTIVHTAEYECDYDIPYNNHSVRKIDNTNYQIEIWEEGDSIFGKPSRIIDVWVENVLSFGGRHFKLGDEVEVD